MLPKQKRLTTAEFDHFFGIGKRFHSQHLSLVYMPFVATKAAVVVGKKVYKKAVDRNQLRRQLYHLLRQQLNDAPRGVYIVLTKPAAKTSDSTALAVELKELIGRTSNS